MPVPIKMLGKGIFSFFIFRIFSIALSLFTTIILARSLSTSEFGLFMLAMSIIGLFSFGIDLRIRSVFVKCIPEYLIKDEKEKMRELIGSGFVIKALLGITFSVLLLAFAGYISNDIYHLSGMSILLYIGSLSLLFMALSDFSTSIAHGHQKFTLTAFLETLNIAVYLLLLISFLIFSVKFRAEYAMISKLIAAAAPVIVGFFYIRKLINLRPRFTARATKFILVFSAPLAVSTLTDYISGRVDSLIIGYFWETASVGYYTLALNIASLVMLITMPFVRTFLPIMSQAHISNRKGEIAEMYEISMVCSFFASILLILFFSIFSPEIISGLYGDKYVYASKILPILSIAFAFQAYGGLGGPVLLAYNKQNYLMHIGGIYAVLNIILNLILVRKFGAIGAGFALLVASLIGLGLWLLILKKKVGISLTKKKTIWMSSIFGIYVAISLLSTYFFSFTLIHKILLFIVAAASLILCTYFLVLDNSERRRLHRLPSSLRSPENS